MLPRHTPFYLAVLAAVAFGCLDSALAPAPGEPWLLRWVRVAADHPLRTWLAIWLVLLAGIPQRARKALPGTLE